MSPQVISTLDRRRLQESDYLPLLDRGFSDVCFTSDINAISIIRYKAPGSSDTGGFLYYFNPPGLHESAGQVRFRVTPSTDPSSYNQGTDLLDEHGFIWNMPISYDPEHNALREQLLRDGLVSQSLLTWCKEVAFDRRYKRILHFLEQPFLYDFDARSITLRIIGRHGVGVSVLRGLCSSRLPHQYPYTGSY